MKSPRFHSQKTVGDAIPGHMWKWRTEDRVERGLSQTTVRNVIWSFKAIYVLSYIHARMYKILAFYNPKQKRFQCMKRGQYNISKRQKSCLDCEIFLAWVTTLCDFVDGQRLTGLLLSLIDVPFFFSNPFFTLNSFAVISKPNVYF